jgi:site-specific recombinase XerD
VLAQRPELGEKARAYARGAKSNETWRAYENDWRTFSNWCDAHGVIALPASTDTVAGYLIDLAENHATATVERHCSSISQRHRLTGHNPAPTSDPAVRQVLQGIRRKKGVKSLLAKAPVDMMVLKKMIGTLDLSTLEGQRDRAILTLGFASSCRRSEITALNVEDMVVTEQGLVFTIHRSKTDQLGEGRVVAVAQAPEAMAAVCPVRAIRNWLERARIRHGPIARGLTRYGLHARASALSGGGVAKIVKRAAEAAGLDPALFGGHSLRSGHVTEARKRGVPWDRIMEQTGHKRLETVKRYDKGTKDPFKVSSARDVFK